MNYNSSLLSNFLISFKRSERVNEPVNSCLSPSFQI